MQPYQERYIANTAEIRSLSDLYRHAGADFDTWFQRQREDRARIARLREENLALLQEQLFPVLDELHSAPEETLRELTDFAAQLMDWKTNLDCGVYVAVHDAMLSLCRFRRDRDGVIRELYLLGMGMYYLRRTVEGVDLRWSGTFYFQNELLFSEAAAYLRYFEELPNEETKGYIIRSLANISLCTRESKRRIAISARTLQILQDEHYRALAPSLPWDAFLRRTHQQMSANRSELSRGSLSAEELATVLDSCYEVFKPEESAANPSIRWLWPYYEMEYSCGYVDQKTTLERLESLISRTPYDQYDVSGLYGNVQLPIYYGRLVAGDEKLRADPLRLRFLEGAYRKMLKALLCCPTQRLDDYFVYLLDLVITDFREMEGGLLYSDVMPLLMQRFTGELYIRSRRAGALLRCFSEAIFDRESAFFDDIPFLCAIADPAQKRAALLDYAEGCGLYHDFGQIKMNLARTQQTRSLFENEFQMYRLHTVSGYDDLRKRPSTERYADIALGHHRWYDGSQGYPEEYVRTDSACRQMTDLTALVSFLIDEYEGDLPALAQRLLADGGRQFSPLVTAWLTDESLLAALEEILRCDGRDWYRSVYESAFGAAPEGECFSTS